MKPIIAVVCDVKQHGPHLYQQAGEKYLNALRQCSNAIPVLVPSLTEKPITTPEILSVADAILFTGGYSNIARQNYGGTKAPAGELEDPARDSNTLKWLPEVIEAGLPLFCICRGLQELNVALGGTLHPRLHDVPGRMDHQEDETTSLDIQYGPAHSVTVNLEGELAKILKNSDSFMVNSLHGQGIHTLAKGLAIEAQAGDTTIEAVSVVRAKTFAIAVQWHPEWQAATNPQSKAIFKAFGDAARTYRNNKHK